jgi:anti-sigma factor RsiW
MKTVKVMNAANCEGVSDLLEAFFDGELSAPERETVDRHVQDCAECKGHLAELGVLRSRLRGLPRYKTPAALGARIKESLRKDAGNESDVVMWRRWAAPVATHLSAAIAGIAAAYLIFVPNMQLNGLTQELVAAHVRSLMSPSSIDVASSDTHQVGPWFAGKLDFAPRVRNFSEQGFPLLGGRVDYFAGRKVGVLVYRHRLHTINVFVMPHVSRLEPSNELRQNGYNIARFGDGEFDYWAISDLNADELSVLGELLAKP